MKWVYPEFLFALAVIAIPLLIHLFHFKRYKTIFFSSLTFLKSIEQEQRSIRKLKQWLIFACRALAFSFLVFAFAQPYIPLDSNASKKAGKQLIALYVDNSFSMSRLGESGELLSQAKQLAKSVIEDAPRDAQFILITNELGSEEKQTLNKAACLEKIEKIEYTPLVRSANNIAGWWQEWISESKKNGMRYAAMQFVFLSDFQKQTLGKLNTYKPSEWSSDLYPILLRPVNEGNLYVDSIWFASPIHKKDSKQTLYAKVVNTSKEAVRQVEVSYKIGGITRDVYADIPAGGSDTVEVSYFNSSIGNTFGSVRINDKQMTQDDAFFFSFNVKEKGTVIILDGEEAVPNVARVYKLDEYYDVKSMPQNQLTSTTANSADLVVVNGSNNLSSATAQYLYEFAKNGGTLLLFPGSNPTPSGWNALLSKVQLPQLSGLQENGLTLKKITVADAFFDGVFERKPENISMPLIKKAVRYAGGKSFSTALIQHQNGTPFFVKGTGDYSVYACSAPLGTDYSSFTSNQLFSTLLLRTGELSQRQAPYFLVIGEQGKFPLNEVGSSEEPVMLTSSSVEFIPQVYVQNEQAFIQVQGIEAVRQLVAGNYSIKKGTQKLGGCSVNYNRSESATAAYTEGEVQNYFETAGIPVKSTFEAKNWSGASFLKLDQPITYWKLCIIIALLFLGAEMVIVLFFKK